MRAIILSLVLCVCSVFCSEALRVQGREFLPGGETLSGHGHGIAVSKRHVLTARHVIMNTDDTAFRAPYVQIGKDWIEGTKVADDEQHDLALIELPETVVLKPVEVLAEPKLEVHGNLALNEDVVREVTIDEIVMGLQGIKVRSPYDIGGYSGSPILAEKRLIGILSAGRLVGNPDEQGYREVQVRVIGLSHIRAIIKPYIKE